MYTDLPAAIAEMYDYDAYGQMLAIFNGTGTLTSGGNGVYADVSLALTNLLYSGEQFDTRIGLQYLRARYYDAASGMFNRLDPFFGNDMDPQSFHKYLYTHADPVNRVDPTGESAMSVSVAIGVATGVIAGLVAYSQGYTIGQSGDKVYHYTPTNSILPYQSDVCVPPAFSG